MATPGVKMLSLAGATGFRGYFEYMEKELMMWIGGLTDKIHLIDALALLCISTDLIKGGPFALGILAAWVIPSEKESQPNNKVYTLRIILTVLLSILFARIAQNFITSPRPIMVEEIARHFGKSAQGARLDWNSFPSDHMALYFPIALMIYLRFKKFGKVLIAWSILVVGLPRIFLGRHYPTDVLGGMVIGSAMLAIVWLNAPMIDPYLQKVTDRLEKRPLISLAFIFSFAFLVATVFDNARWMIQTVMGIIQYYKFTLGL